VLLFCINPQILEVMSNQIRRLSSRVQGYLAQMIDSISLMQIDVGEKSLYEKTNHSGTKALAHPCGQNDCPVI
jgi:hypothetical protein